MKNPIVLVVVIVVAVVAIGVTVYKMQGPAATPKGETAVERKVASENPMKCGACGYTAQMNQAEASELPAGGKDLYKCPKCGKFSLGFVLKCDKHGEFLADEIMDSCPTCRAADAPK